LALILGCAVRQVNEGGHEGGHDVSLQNENVRFEQSRDQVEVFQNGHELFAVLSMRLVWVRAFGALSNNLNPR
jgi:hypothetical protein